ncbi:MAG: ATP-binding protein [Xanthomonadales bacterium]|nr:ATP-binding protein [Xanthomonadales bacterium]
MKLRPKLILQTIPLVVVPVLAFGIFALIQFGNASNTASQRQALAALDQVEREFDAVVSTARANVELFSNSSYLRKYVATSDEEIRHSLLHGGLMDLFSSYQAAYPEYVEISVILPGGYEDARITRGSIANATDDESSNPFFQALAQEAADTYVEFLLNPDFAQPVLQVGRALRFEDSAISGDGTQALYGFLVMKIAMTGLLEHAGAHESQLFTGLHFVDARGQDWLAGDAPAVSPEILTSILGAPEGALLRDEPDGAKSIWSARTLDRNLIAVQRVPEREFASAGQQLRNVLLASLVVAVVGTMIILFVLIDGQLIRPVARMSAAAHSMGEGELRVTLRKNSNDEIGHLASTLEAMGNRLFDMREAEAGRAAELKSSNEKLTQAVNESERAKEAAQTASMAKTEFLTRMSHEIRTPMNGVLGMAELLRDTELTEQQQRHADTIHKSGMALLAIINDILDFSKIEAGKLTLDQADFSIPELVKQVAESHRKAAAEKGLGLTTHISAKRSERVSGDPARVGQVLNNLVSNAVKFTESGQISIRVEQEQIDENGAVWTVFEVADSGIGINDKSINRIFESFDQEDGSSTRKFGGAGLGLTISKQLVDLMGGSLSVDSTLGAGSRFSFRLPLYPALERTQPAGGAQPFAVQPIDAVVLIVEDNPTNLEVAKGMLESLHCEALEAVDGLEAVHQVRRGGVDVVLMDCQLPVMDGFAATEAIRSWEAEHGILNPIPIIALTADALEGDRERCLKAGMDDYLTKPLTVEELHQKLDQWLNDHGQPVESAAAGS